MADPTAPVVAPVEPIVAAAPAIAPVVADAPLVTSEPVAVEPVVSVEPVAAAEPVVAPVEAKPEPAPSVEAEKPAEPVVAEPEAPAAVEPPKYDLKTADDFKVAPEKLSGYTDILAKHNIAPEAAQEIFDLYQTEAKAFQEAQAQHQQEVWAKTNADWVKEGKKLFGNHYDTTVNDARRAISDLFPDKKERTAIWDAFSVTGAGNHPMIIRAFARAARKMGESSIKLTQVPGSGRDGQRPEDRRYSGQKS